MTVSAGFHSSARMGHKAKEARKRKRIRMSVPVGVRPFDARFIDIEDVGELLDFTQDGLLFVTSMPHYQLGMRLIVTFPYREAASGHSKFLATVVRVDERPCDHYGVAVRFLL
jgi:hypothetical protein